MLPAAFPICMISWPKSLYRLLLVFDFVMCACSYACCESGTKPAATASSFRIVLVRCLLPRPRAGGVVDGGGGSEGEKVKSSCRWCKEVWLVWAGVTEIIVANVGFRPYAFFNQGYC